MSRITQPAVASGTFGEAASLLASLLWILLLMLPLLFAKSVAIMVAAVVDQPEEVDWRMRRRKSKISLGTGVVDLLLILRMLRRLNAQLLVL
jgi:hypothetical protein